MKKSVLIAIAFLFLSCFSANAQNPVRCSSFDYLNQQLAQNPGLQQAIDQEEQNTTAFVANHPNGYQARAVCVIPVVFHVVYATSGQNISNQRILDQLDVLNKDYRKLNTDANLVPSVWQPIAADCEIEFCLAKHDPTGNWTDGIERVSTTTSSWTTNDNVKHASSGGADAWDRSKYLNIWVCNLGGGLLGYSTFPGGPANVDGCVLAFSYVGTTGTVAPYNKGRTATHEIGHWLNLKHIWGDDGSSCSGSDGVSDTPNQSSENYGCPTFPHTDACSPNSPGVMFMNYMDYTDDACMYIFTEGQKTRIWAALNSSRLTIQTSDACMVTGIAEATLQSAFSVNPSPTTGAFTLNFGNGSPEHFDLTIFNVLGEIVYTHHYDALNEAELHLDLEGNAPGIYMVEVRTATARTTKKIILE
ncbi:MAG TPA: M43 family zinc metalloprotease [Bacteroidia bacterium]|nr:M43 family zinc metalloprotease [Bacteroidia bacterium]